MPSLLEDVRYFPFLVWLMLLILIFFYFICLCVLFFFCHGIDFLRSMLLSVYIWFMILNLPWYLLQSVSVRVYFKHLTRSSWIPPAFLALTINMKETACGKKFSRMLSNSSDSPIPGVSTIMTFPWIWKCIFSNLYHMLTLIFLLMTWIV